MNFALKTIVATLLVMTTVSTVLYVDREITYAIAVRNAEQAAQQQRAALAAAIVLDKANKAAKIAADEAAKIAADKAADEAARLWADEWHQRQTRTGYPNDYDPTVIPDTTPPPVKRLDPYPNGYDPTWTDKKPVKRTAR